MERLAKNLLQTKFYFFSLGIIPGQVRIGIANKRVIIIPDKH